MKPAIREHLLVIAKEWKEFAKIPDEAIVNYTITGGNCNYNWSELSDIDIHILVDQTKMPISDPDLQHDYIMLKKNVWKDKHPFITIMGYPVEIYAQFTSETQPVGQGVYSLSSNSWLIEPQYLNIDFSNPELKHKVGSYISSIDKAISFDDFPMIKAIKDQIVMNRGIGLAKDGEFSNDNEAFKALRNNGYLQKLSDYITRKQDAAYSFNESYTPEEMEIANKTSRSGGAISSNAIVPRYVRDNVSKTHKILDFGAGKDALHTQNLRKEGFNVTAHEFGNNQKPGLHDINALSKQYDTAYASNVLNTQSSPEMLDRTISSIKGSLHPTGQFIGNLPLSPRKYGDLNADHLHGALSKHFETVERVGGTKQAPIFKASRPKN